MSEPFAKEKEQTAPVIKAVIQATIDNAVKEAVATEREEILELLKDFIDEYECSYDHHGYCQTHGWFATYPICPHKRARMLLKKARSESEG